MAEFQRLKILARRCIIKIHTSPLCSRFALSLSTEKCMRLHAEATNASAISRCLTNS